MTDSASLTAENTSRFTQLDKIKVHYNEAGSGPVVIMLHGSGAGASGWSNFYRNIGPISQNHRVLAVDQLGYGGTGHYDGIANTTENNAKMIRDLLDALKIDKASIVGNSMGGASALNFGIDYPDRAHRLVFMGTATGANDALLTPTPTEGVKALMAAGAEPTVENLRRLFAVMVYDSSFVTDELLQSRVDAAHATRRPANFSPSGFALARDLTRELDKCTAKTLLIHGTHDRVAPLEASLRLTQRMPDAQLHVYSKAGHWCQYERADEFNRLVIDFIDH